MCHVPGVRWPRTSTCLLFALLVVACDVYHPEAFDNYDAGLDAAFDAGEADGGRICELRHPPARAAGMDGDGAELVYALRDVTIAQADPIWNDLGFDLDQTCSDTMESVTCTPQGGATPQLDGVGGVDNSGGRELLGTLTLGDPTLEMRAREVQAAGTNVIVLRVSGWDGSDDDPRVTASIAQGVYAFPSGGMRGDPLAWDGTDTFVVSEEDYLDGDPDRPLIVDDAAYVAGRRLVMNLPEGRPIYLPWEGNPLILRLTDAFLIADLSADGATVTDARLVGRWALLDLSSTLTQLGVCPGTSIRLAIDILVARVADIRSDPGTDGLALDCDAVSFAIGFQGTRGRFGGTTAAPPLLDPCGT